MALPAGPSACLHMTTVNSCWERFRLPGFLLKCFSASVLGLSGTGDRREKWQKSYIKSLSFQESDFLPFFQENKEFWQRLQRCWQLIPLSRHSDDSCAGPRGSPALLSGTLQGLLHVGCVFIVDVRILASCPSLTTSSQRLEL